MGTYKTLGVPQMDAGVLEPLKQMGQELFYPPNVAGWPGGENWLNSDTMIARQNFLKRAVNSQTIAQSSWLRGMPLQPKSVASELVAAVLQGDAAPASVYKLNGYLGGAGTSALAALSPENYDERVSGAAYLTMSMPAYQLSCRREKRNMRRSNFLLGTVSGLAVVASGDHVFAQALAQSPLPGLPGSQNRCLVIVNLNGGNDGLNCIVPHGDSQYYRVRPSLAIAAARRAAQINSQLGFNPRMRSLKAMYDKGMVAIVQGVGYPNADHSHFRSSEIWQTGVPDKYEHTGWIGRYLDEADLPAGDLFKGVAVSQVLPEVLVANKTDVPAISNLGQYGLIADRDPMARTAYAQQSRDKQLPFTSPYLAHVMEIEDHAQRTAPRSCRR